MKRTLLFQLVLVLIVFGSVEVKAQVPQTSLELINMIYEGRTCRRMELDNPVVIDCTYILGDNVEFLIQRQFSDQNAELA